MSTISNEIDPNSPWKEVFPGAASLLEHIDKRIFVWLRDGKMYVGFLRSVDQFANLVLYSAFERLQISHHYTDVPQGAMMIRGENVALLGEIGEDHGEKHLGNELFTFLVTKEDKLKEINRYKERAYWQRGLVFCSDDYF